MNVENQPGVCTYTFLNRLAFLRGLLLSDLQHPRTAALFIVLAPVRWMSGLVSTVTVRPNVGQSHPPGVGLSVEPIKPRATELLTVDVLV